MRPRISNSSACFAVMSSGSVGSSSIIAKLRSIRPSSTSLITFGAVVVAETVERIEDRHVEFVSIELRCQRFSREYQSCDVKILLANSEASTHGVKRTSRGHVAM